MQNFLWGKKPKMELSDRKEAKIKINTKFTSMKIQVFQF